MDREVTGFIYPVGDSLRHNPQRVDIKRRVVRMCARFMMSQQGRPFKSGKYTLKCHLNFTLLKEGCSGPVQISGARVCCKLLSKDFGSIGQTRCALTCLNEGEKHMSSEKAVCHKMG